jgi:hypothetical protein
MTEDDRRNALAGKRFRQSLKTSFAVEIESVLTIIPYALRFCATHCAITAVYRRLSLYHPTRGNNMTAKTAGKITDAGKITEPTPISYDEGVELVANAQEESSMDLGHSTLHWLTHPVHGRIFVLVSSAGSSVAFPL